MLYIVILLLSCTVAAMASPSYNNFILFNMYFSGQLIYDVYTAVGSNTRYDYWFLKAYSDLDYMCADVIHSICLSFLSCQEDNDKLFLSLVFTYNYYYYSLVFAPATGGAWGEHAPTNFRMAGAVLPQKFPDVHA